MLILMLLVIPVYGRAAEQAVSRFDRVAFDGIELEYQVRGAGAPIVFVHAGVFADWFEPLLDEAALKDRYRMVTYHRVGYAGSSDVIGPVSIAQQAVHLRSLLRKLEIRRAHLVGHSSGGIIALQLALDAPEIVHSLSLLEPALPVSPASAQRRPETKSGVALAMESYRAGNDVAAVDVFMQAVAGPGYRAVVQERLPQAFGQAIADADTFFRQELPAVQQWSFHEEDARRIRQPVLAVMGARSHEVSPIWQQRQDLMNAWLPNVEAFVLSDATHLLHVQNSRDLAERLATFFEQHSLTQHDAADE